MTGTRATPLARAAFAALVAASFLAFFYAQELKGRDPLLKGWTHVDVRFPRTGAKFAHFHVTATVSGPLSASVVAARGGRAVDVVHVVVHRYQRHAIVWDGRTSAGAPAPPGVYHVTVLVRGASVPVTLTGLTLTLEATS
jgi:hypothetical protein